MANIKLKNINELNTWTPKELRKLRMTINNRISSLETSNSPKELPESHPLHGMESGECKILLEKVIKAEKGN